MPIPSAVGHLAISGAVAGGWNVDPLRFPPLLRFWDTVAVVTYELSSLMMKTTMLINSD